MSSEQSSQLSSEESGNATAGSGKPGRSAPPSAFRRGSVRALAPVSAIAIVAAGAAIAPNIASAAPALPQITAQKLLTKAMQSKVDAFSGTVSLTTNLGLPALPDVSGRANPLSLLSGTHILQVAADGPQKQRIALLDTMAEYDVVHNGKDVWLYDSQQNSVSHATSQGTGTMRDHSGKTNDAPEQGVPLTPQQAAQQLLSAVSPTTNIAVDQTLSVAHRAAYVLVVTPKEKGSLIGRVEVAIDAQNGAPLQVAVYPTGSNTAAFEIGFTSVSFSAPPASRFDFTPPKGSTVSPMTGNGAQTKSDLPTGASLDPQVLGQDWLSVVELHGIDLNQLRSAASSANGQDNGGDNNATGLFNGNASSYLDALLGAGTNVSGGFGSGKLYTTNFLSVLITNDGRLFVGSVTPSVLEAAASAQGTK
jgi:outer membrane lipoprotein-sorting protein